MDVKPAELKLAQQLIEQQSVEKFDPSAYTDEVRARVEAAVQKKVEGQEITMAEAPEQGAQVIDLMEALARQPGEEAGEEGCAGRSGRQARRAEGRQEITCTSSGCGRWKSSCACRAARSARWSRPDSSPPAAARATRCASRSRT